MYTRLISIFGNYHNLNFSILLFQLQTLSFKGELEPLSILKIYRKIQTDLSIFVPLIKWYTVNPLQLINEGTKGIALQKNCKSRLIKHIRFFSCLF